MPQKLVGNTWLKEKFKLHRHNLTHSSYIGHKPSIELTSKGDIEQVYSIRQYPGDRAVDHLEFSLKYDDLNLDFLKSVLENIPEEEILQYVHAAPSGRYTRKAGFLYEFLTGKKLTLQKPITGTYVDLLDAEKYLTGKSTGNARWHVANNLLGTPDYCPIVRRTKKLNELLEKRITDKIETLRTDFPPAIFKKATDYLYRKETKSSYEIEREEPSPDRMEKFIALLMQAGHVPSDEMLSEKRLVELQHTIVDPRFADKGFRDFQNYVGSSLSNYREVVHYICPPPEIVGSLMKGIQQTAMITAGLPAEARAAVIAFGFVFIHPFEDGNGRIHRFLIHDVLVNEGIVPRGIIIPVSAHMVNHLKEYDSILEAYSKPLMQFARYELRADGTLLLKNPQETEGYFRYPDLTDHCVYLAETIHATLDEDMTEELIFLQRYDEIKADIQNIVDMPDKLIDQMIKFLHQNRGAFPKRRREYFKKLTDEEIARMETAFRKVFELE